MKRGRLISDMRSQDKTVGQLKWCPRSRTREVFVLNRVDLHTRSRVL